MLNLFAALRNTSTRATWALGLSLALLTSAGCGKIRVNAPKDSATWVTESAPDNAAACLAEVCSETCCLEACVNTRVDPAHCGGCGLACGDNELCGGGICVCIPGTPDCPSTATESTCGPGENCATCAVGDERQCYDGPAHTLNVGTCVAGRQVCSSAGWSPCMYQVLPSPEPCEANEKDEDCNGVPDDDSDYDGDGWTHCGGDCCDSIHDRCDRPAFVNPGAYDYPNSVDDDCDGHVDNAPNQRCSNVSMTSNVSANRLLNAMDLCQFTTPDSENWGVLNATLSLADGTNRPDPMQMSVLTSFGSLVTPRANDTLAVLSSGRARGVNDPGHEPGDTSYSSWESGVNAPARYTAVHSSLQTASACPTADPLTQDSVLLRMKMRVPTNAQGFQYQFRFFSFEYPVYLCTQYNDFFLALLDSRHDMIPEDGNISFDRAGNPVTINSAFFTSCESLQCADPEIFSIQQGPDANHDGCVDSLTCNTDTNYCEGPYGACPDGPEDVRAFTESNNVGGGTSWLITTAPVVPGEIITLDFHIWDTTDSLLDSTVILDNFQWRFEPTGLSTSKQ